MSAPPAQMSAKNVQIATGWLRDGITITQADAATIRTELAKLEKRITEVTA